MKTLVMTGAFLLLICAVVRSQVGINTDGSAPDSTAILDVKSTSKGFLPPRMTTDQRNAIEFPAEGLLIFNTTTGCVDYYLGGSWKSLGGVSEPVFGCGMKMTDPRDGKRYNTVKIGSQCWMAENLNYGTRVNGNIDQVNNQVVEKYCYGDLEVNCWNYGGLYQWGEVAAYLNGTSNYATWNPVPEGYVQGICPQGWHLPSMNELDDLVAFTGGGSVAGGILKEAGFEHWIAPNAGGSNRSGFSALPGGMRIENGTFSNIFQDALFWSGTETYTAGAWSLYLNNEFEFADALNNAKVLGLSVRCVMD
jgi:uncharacterized protein (TIGR02145 family)